MIRTLLLSVLMLVTAEEAGALSVAVVRSDKASFQVRMAGREVRRYLYLRTGELVRISTPGARFKTVDGIVIGVKGAPHLKVYVKDKALTGRIDALKPQQYVIKTVASGGGRAVLIVGGDAVGALYGAYRFIEHFGVRFYLHGDVIPDKQVAWKTPEIDVTHKPLFALRGINTWGSHPFGFDQWNADDYRSTIAQLAKMRMNFIGMHCYLTHPYTEPTVWIGTPDGFDKEGKVTGGYPARYYNTLWKGRWGPILPGKTGDYPFGAAIMFEDDAWGPDVIQGLCPTPTTPEGCNKLFNRVGAQFSEAFSFAKLVGVKTCLGTEAPMKKFMPKELRARLTAKGLDPNSPEVLTKIYEGVFERIKAAHPLDYYWIWTPEGWTWRGNSAKDMQATVDDVKIAADALKKVGSPFKLATSGWVLGPKGDRAAFDKMVPKSIAMSAISRQIGYTPVDPAYGQITGREKWAIPWLESDDFLASPQLWVARTRKDAAAALAYKCDGLMGLHWRTRIMGPNASAMARAGWDQSWNTTAPATKTPKPAKPKRDVVLGGKTANYPGQQISGTKDDVIYQTCRYNFAGYRLIVPNGKYRITLKFCEPHFNAADKRVCYVKLQDKVALRSFDIFAKVGKFAACDQSFNGVEVKDGVLKVGIVNRKSMACISGIAIEGKGFTRKINCGGPAWKGYSADPRPTGGTWRGGNVPRGLPAGDFYRDWAMTSFGAEVADKAAAIFEKIDGKVPQPLGGGCPSGSIRANPQPWDKVAGDYAFVDELAALRPDVKGAGNRERFDYWLNTFKYQRSLAKTQCMLPTFIRALKADEHQKDPANKAKTALPIYRQLIAEYGRTVRLRMATVTTNGGIATIVNLLQHARFRPAVIDNPAKRITAALGKPLPADAMPSKAYQGPGRIIVPTVRTSLVAGESLKLKAIVLSEAPAKAIMLNWRALGGKSFRKVPLKHVARGVYSITLGAGTIAGNEFEYHITAQAPAELHYPVTAPKLNNTVIVVPR